MTCRMVAIVAGFVRRWPFTVSTLAIALALTGCGGNGDRTARVVATLKDALVRQAGPNIKVSNVSCVHGSGAHYKCRATFTAGGQSATVSYVVTCDDKRCLRRRV